MSKTNHNPKKRKFRVGDIVTVSHMDNLRFKIYAITHRYEVEWDVDSPCEVRKKYWFGFNQEDDMYLDTISMKKKVFQEELRKILNEI